MRKLFLVMEYLDSVGPMGNLGINGPVHRDGLLVVEPVHDNDDKAVIAQGPGPHLSTFKPVHDKNDKAVITQWPSPYIPVSLLRLMQFSKENRLFSRSLFVNEQTKKNVQKYYHPSSSHHLI